MRKIVIFIGLILIIHSVWAQPVLTHFEYWFDTDINQRVSVDVNQGASYNEALSFGTDQLDMGLHILNVRMKDENGLWSSVNTSFFQKVPNVAQTSNEIRAYQFWIDNNIADRITVESAETNLDYSMDVNNVDAGLHLFTCRVMDAHGAWSPPQSTFFMKNTSVTVASPLIERYEYWFNDRYDEKVVVSLETPMNPYQLVDQIQTPVMQVGDHLFTIRFRATSGQWSEPHSTSFAIASCNIAKGVKPVGDVVSCSSETENIYTTSRLNRVSDYLWQIEPENAATLSANDTAAVLQWNPEFTGDVNIWIVPANACGEGEPSDTLIVSRVANPEGPSLNDTSFVEFCSGDSIVFDAPAGYSYLWQDYSDSQSFTAKESGGCYVRITNEFGCYSYSDTIQVEVHPTPYTPEIIADGNSEFCMGDSVMLIEEALPKDTYTYLWSTGETTETIWAKQSGNYTLQLISEFGCEGIVSEPVEIVVNPNPEEVTISDTSYIDFCEGGSVEFEAPEGYDYLWSDGTEEQTCNASTYGDYYVQITNEFNCFSFSDTVEVDVHPTPYTPEIIADGDSEFCMGDSVMLIEEALPKDTYTYLWSTGETTETIWVNQTGGYSLMLISEFGCEGEPSETVTVNVYDNPAIPVITHTDNTLAAPYADSYQWYVDMTPVAGLVPVDGATDQEFTPEEDGIYAVEVLNENGCSAMSDPLEVILVGISNHESLFCNVYPNPSQGQFVVQVDDSMIGATVYVYNSTGALMMNQTVESEKTGFDLPDYSGVVHIQVVQKQKVFNKMIVVQ